MSESNDRAMRKYRATPLGLQTRREAVRAFRQRLHDATDAIKLAAGCADCGVVPQSPSELDFDHVPGRGDKLFNIADGCNTNKPLAVILAEIAKCDVVCKPCHRAGTAERRAA